MIVMNTTHHWREFASALLSREFLTLAQAHLREGGIVGWNCTDQPEPRRPACPCFRTRSWP